MILKIKMEKCRNNNCTNNADYRYTWAGKDESFICEEHSKKMKSIAKAIGYYIQLIPLDNEKEKYWVIFRPFSEEVFPYKNGDTFENISKEKNIVNPTANLILVEKSQ